MLKSFPLKLNHFRCQKLILNSHLKDNPSNNTFHNLEA